CSIALWAPRVDASSATRQTLIWRPPPRKCWHQTTWRCSADLPRPRTLHCVMRRTWSALAALSAYLVHGYRRGSQCRAHFGDGGRLGAVAADEPHGLLDQCAVGP